MYHQETRQTPQQANICNDKLGQASALAERFELWPPEPRDSEVAYRRSKSSYFPPWTKTAEAQRGQTGPQTLCRNWVTASAL